MNGQPISRVLIENGSEVNIFPLTVFRNMGKLEVDLIPTEVYVTAFMDKAKMTIEVFHVEVLVGSK